MRPKETSNDKIRLRKRPEMTLSKLPMAQPQADLGHSLSVRLPWGQRRPVVRAILANLTPLGIQVG